MRSLANKLRLVALLGLSAGILAPVPAAQRSAQRAAQVPRAPRSGIGEVTVGDEEQDPFQMRINDKQLRSLNALRQKRLVADTDKLLQLAADLKAEVDKPGKEGASGDSVRKAEEIQKLAKSVRERMKSFP